MAGNERSGNKPLGRHALADRMMALKLSIRAKYARLGITDAEQDDLDELDRCILANEMLGAKAAIRVALEKDEAVIDRAVDLARDYEATYGPLSASVWDLLPGAGKAA